MNVFKVSIAAAIMMVSIHASGQRTCLEGCSDGNRVSVRFNPEAAQAMFDSLFFRLDSLTAYVEACGCAGGGSSSSSHPCAAGSIEFQGYTYGTIDIGGKTWFVENLQTTTFANGDIIPSSPNTWDGFVEWSALSTPARFDLDNEANATTRGRLYNWFAVEDARGLCPAGWHVADDADWNHLATAIGGKTGGGDKLKSSPTDTPDWDGTNEACFSAVNASYRYDNPTDPNIVQGVSAGWDLGVNANLWWSATEATTERANMWLVVGGNSDFIEAGTRSKTHGFSIRCVEDSN